MRVHVALSDDQTIPVNMYAINLAPSGSGKGHSITIIEEDIISAFRQQFLEVTFPAVAEKRLRKLANIRAQRDQTDPDQVRAGRGFSVDPSCGAATGDHVDHQPSC